MDVRLRILGPLTVTDAHGTEVALTALKPRQLLAALVLHRGDIMTPDALMDCLWGEAVPSGAATTLRTYISHVRHVLAAAEVPADLEATKGGYRLRIQPRVLDLDTFEQLRASGREAAGAGRQREALDTLGEAIALWRGDFLSDLGRPPFAEAEAARADELYLSANETYLDSLIATGGHEEAVPRLRELTWRHPFREHLAAQLALCLYRCGRQADALDVLARTRRTLADELGLDPGVELRELETAMLQQDPRLDGEAAATAPSRFNPDDLVEMTSFVGRSEVRTRIRDLLDSNRAVTLTGFGGVGKTRLAVRVANDVRHAYQDGVHFVWLADIDREASVANGIADTLGLDGWTAHAAEESVIAYLADRSALLVLDNCEHVVGTAARVSDRILQSCPGISILATSREPLRNTGETTYAVPPMALGGAGAGHETARQPSEAAQLFVARARTRDPDFALDPEIDEAVEEICRKLEGIPLAIELAVARLGVATPQELSADLTHHWRSLNRGARDAPARQATMAACIEWSFDLCGPVERAVWARTSVFVDSFDLEAAAAVSRDMDRTILGDVLAALVDKSIVRNERQGGVMRFRLLPPLRERGLAELVRLGEDGAARRLHRDFFVDLALQFHAERFGRRQLLWIHRLRNDLGNLRAAIEFCATPDSARIGLRALAHLMEFVCIEGLFRQARGWVDELVAADPRAAESIEGAHAVAAACWWAIIQADLGSAAGLLDRCRRVLADAPDDGLGILMQLEGFRATFSGDTALASVLLRQAAEGFKGRGDRDRLGQTLSLLAVARAFDGDVDGALEAHRGCLDITEPTGEMFVRGVSTWAAGLAVLAAGDRDRARELLMDALRLRRRIGERLGVASTIEGLAYVAASDDPGRATTLLAAAENEWERVETSSSALPGLGVQRQRVLTHLRDALTHSEFSVAWQRGRELSQDEAVSLALGRADALAAAASSGRG